MTTFVLIHGAFRGGWYWRDVARALRAHGDDVYAPSLTGAGDRQHIDQAVSLRTYVDDVAGVLESHDLRDVVLVGHSFGGVPITAASEVCAERIARLVYLDAPEPRDGERAVDLLPVAARGLPLPDASAILRPRPIDAAEAGIDPAVVAWANPRLAPFPVAPSLEPVRLRHHAALALPRSYAFCRDTPATYPAALTRERLDEAGVAYQVLPAGHDAPLQAPTMVVQWLRAIAAQEN